MALCIGAVSGTDVGGKLAFVFYVKKDKIVPTAFSSLMLSQAIMIRSKTEVKFIIN